MIVEVDRDSVAMGDDLESHRLRFEVPADLRVGELAIWAWDHYLARVAGDVLWIMRARVDAGAQRAERDLVAIHTVYDVGSGASRPSFASVHRRWTSFERLEDAVPPDDDGARRLEFGYFSGGGLIALDRYRSLFARDAERPASSA